MSGDADPKGAKSDAGSKKGDGDKITLTQAELDAKMAEVRRGVETSVSKKYADYDDLKAKSAQLDQLEESKKTDEQKLLDRIATLEKSDAENKKALEESKVDILRERVAAKRGLTPAQATRLQGSSLDELEADATELFGEPSDDPDTSKPPEGKPRPDLKGGGDPEEDTSFDVDEVLKQIPR